MLWYKAWLDTRWRFLIGLALLTIVACGSVFDYRAVEKLLPMAQSMDTSKASGPLGQLIKSAIETERDFRGFIWWQWFQDNLRQLATLFAALLGSGSLLRGSSGGAALFTLSLPVTRGRLLGVRVVTGLGELLVLAVIPSLGIPLLSPSIGQHYSLVDTLIHGGCVFIAAAVFFSLATWLSTIFSDLWRPLLIPCAIGVVLALAEFALPGIGRYGLFHVMSAETYFRTGTLPWMGLLVSVLMSGGLLYAAAANLAQRDF